MFLQRTMYGLEKIIKDYMEMVTTIKFKTDSGIYVGVLPRMKEKKSGALVSWH